MVDTFHNVINGVSFILNVVGSLIIISGVAVALFEFLKKGISIGEGAVKKTEIIRIGLGSYLVFGLEFFIAGDIIKTIITPTWESIGMLGTIVVIRSILSFFLTRDLKKI